jgi:hypothetical protein
MKLSIKKWFKLYKSWYKEYTKYQTAKLAGGEPPPPPPPPPPPDDGE